MVLVITLVTQSIWWVCLAINTVGLLRSSTNNKISVRVAGSEFVPSLPPFFCWGLWFSVSDVG